MKEEILWEDCVCMGIRGDCCYCDGSGRFYFIGSKAEEASNKDEEPLFCRSCGGPLGGQPVCWFCGDQTLW